MYAREYCGCWGGVGGKEGKLGPLAFLTLQEVNVGYRADEGSQSSFEEVKLYL